MSEAATRISTPSGEAPEGKLLDDKLAEFIREIGIPPRPLILEEVSREMHRDDPDLNRIAELVMRDVSLAAGLLKTANSPFFGFRQKARNVREALVMLGLKAAARTIAGLIMRQALPVGPDLERFWDASDMISRLSGWLVRELGAKHGVGAEDAYTYGLFRDCGIPILLRKFPAYAAVLAQANSEAERAFTEVEEDAIPTNHAMVGCMLAQSWWLPETTVEAIRHHHDLLVLESPHGTCPQASRRLIALSQLAEHLLQASTGLSMTREWEKLGVACLERLEIEEDDLPGLRERARAALEAMAEDA